MHLNHFFFYSPEANTEFVCAIEDTLELYKQPYDSKNPKVCIDENGNYAVSPVKPGKLILNFSIELQSFPKGLITSK